MREEEIECLRKVLKGNTMNKLKKLKALHGRSLETGYPLTSRKCSAWASEARNAAKCSDQSLKSSRLKFNPHSIKDQRLKACATRTLLQRSNSVAADHRRHIFFSSLRRSTSLRRNYRPDTNSFEVVVRTHGTDDDRKNCSNEEDLNVLRGLPFTPEIFTSDDTSPLIPSDVEPFGGARNSFDNREIRASRSSLIGDYSVTAAVSVVSDVAAGDNRPVDAQHSTKRDKPELRILTPGYESGINCNLKKMSSVDERHMNEAIELANSFSRLLANDKVHSGQRTPGSFSDECRSPGGHFFGFHKSRPEKEEKLTFAEELSLLATEADRVATPAALEAYEALVKKAVPLKESLRGHFEDNSLLNSINDSASSEGSHEPLFVPDRKCTKVPILTDCHTLISGDDVDFPSRNLPAATCQTRESSMLSRSLSLGNPEKLREFDKKTEVIDAQLPSLSLLPERVKDFEDISPPAYQAPSPPSKLQTVRTELLRQHSEPVKAPFVTAEDFPPPLPEKKSRKDGENLPTDDSPPQYQAPLPPPPAIPPPALPPRIPLKPSTVNSRPYERHFPLASEILPHHSRNGGIPDVPSCRTHNQPQKISRQTSASVVQETHPRIREALSKGLCDSVESRLSSDSDVGNITRESEESALGDSVPPRRPARPCTVDRSPATPNAGGTNHLLKLNIKNIKLNAAELGLHDKADLFWVKSVNFDLPERSLSERDLLQDVCAPIPGRYETSDSVSYEDLMEFALDGSSKTSSSHSLMCDEVRLLMKLFSNDITVEDCMAALAETCWDVHSAVKLIKLKQVMSTGLADKQQCKQALLFCRWNVNDAALYLLTPPQQRITPNLVDV